MNKLAYVASLMLPLMWLGLSAPSQAAPLLIDSSTGFANGGGALSSCFDYTNPVFAADSPVSACTFIPNSPVGYCFNGGTNGPDVFNEFGAGGQPRMPTSTNYLNGPNAAAGSFCLHFVCGTTHCCLQAVCSADFDFISCSAGCGSTVQAFLNGTPVSAVFAFCDDTGGFFGINGNGQQFDSLHITTSSQYAIGLIQTNANLAAAAVGTPEVDPTTAAAPVALVGGMLLLAADRRRRAAR